MLRKILIITCLFGTVFVAFGQKKRKKDKANETIAAANDSAINY